MRAVAVLDLLDKETLGENLLPNAQFSSDHSTVVADLVLEENNNA